MCWICDFKTLDAPHGPSAHAPWAPRRAFLLAAGAAAASPVLAQVDVGKSSAMRQLVPAASLENSATKQYAQVLAEARAKGALAPDNYPQLQRLRAIAARLIPYAGQWNPRAKDWKWEVNLIGNKQINAWCMPGGKIAFYTGILDQLKLTDDEVAMVMGHEMAHALREHARERMAKNTATDLGLRLGAQLLGLEIAARAGYNPQASVALWKKMAAANGSNGPPGFLSTHPTGPERIKQLEANVPKVQGLYEQARNS